MNLQIFGSNSCFDTKKAQRFFKERNIGFQFVDLKLFSLSPKEFESVYKNFNEIDELIDKKSPLYKKLFIEHLAYDEEKIVKLQENPLLFVLPIVRNGPKATVGYQPEVWLKWME
ncbi:MAG: ArsC family transcriptional regulator [Erysipelotrichales bacterium]|nr:ArsC family transcriptional regulator [Erysipelotrichales bacterium]